MKIPMTSPCSRKNSIMTLISYRNLDAYSCSILHRWSTKWPYFSRNSMPFWVCAAMLSYWSWKLNKEQKLTFYKKKKISLQKFQLFHRELGKEFSSIFVSFWSWFISRRWNVSSLELLFLWPMARQELCEWGCPPVNYISDVKITDFRGGSFYNTSITRKILCSVLRNYIFNEG